MPVAMGQKYPGQEDLTRGLRARPQSPRPAQDGRPKPGRDWDEKWVLGGLMAQSSLLAFGSHSPTSEASIVGDARPGLRIPWENTTYDRCSPFAFKIGSTPDPSEPHPHPPIFPSRSQLAKKLAVDNTGLLCLPLHAATVICNWLHIVHNLKVMLHVTTLATTPPCSRSLRAAFASNLGVRSQMSSDKVSRTHNLATQALIRVDLSAQQVRDSGSIEQDKIGIVWVICIKIVILTAPHESQTLAFNYASLALNNSFFLHHLTAGTRMIAIISNFTVRVLHGQNLITYGDDSQTHSTTTTSPSDAAQDAAGEFGATGPSNAGIDCTVRTPLRDAIFNSITKRGTRQKLEEQFDWAAKQADLIAADSSTHGAMFVPIVMGSDKTTVSVATGHQEYHLVYMSPGNLSNIACRAHGNALLPVAFLPIPKTSKRQRKKPQYQKFCRQLYHACLAQIFCPLKPGMITPEVVKCPDGHFRRAIYGLGPYIADYPEQVWLSGIVQGWCPKCLARPDFLDDPSAHCRTHEKTDLLINSFNPKVLWDDYGTRSDVMPFTHEFPRADIHELLCPDLLHQVIKGTFKDHLVTWVNQYQIEEHGETRGLEIIQDIDRRISAVPPFPGLRRFPDGRDFAQWTGDDSKSLMKVYLAAIVGHVPLDMVKCVSAFLDFCYIARHNAISAKGLDNLQDALTRFHQHRDIFIRTGDHDLGPVSGPKVLSSIELAKIPARGYPHNADDLGQIINQPRFLEVLWRFLWDQVISDPSRSPDDLPLDECPRFGGHVNVYHSAVACFYAPSDLCGTGGMYRERIRSTPNWRGEYPRHDTVFVERGVGLPGMHGMLVARVLLFFSFSFRDQHYPCALVHWFIPVGDEPDHETGIWVVRPEFKGNRRSLSIIHLDCIVRGAHLLPVFGSSFLPEEFHFSDSLHAFQAYFQGRIDSRLGLALHLLPLLSLLSFSVNHSQWCQMGRPDVGDADDAMMVSRANYSPNPNYMDSQNDVAWLVRAHMYFCFPRTPPRCCACFLGLLLSAVNFLYWVDLSCSTETLQVDMCSRHFFTFAVNIFDRFLSICINSNEVTTRLHLNCLYGTGTHGSAARSRARLSCCLHSASLTHSAHDRNNDTSTATPLPVTNASTRLLASSPQHWNPHNATATRHARPHHDATLTGHSITTPARCAQAPTATRPQHSMTPTQRDPNTTRKTPALPATATTVGSGGQSGRTAGHFYTVHI
ncbi:hypothetical protein EDB89DRAFT_1907533 [Lactarius sanguifluus]|nr:hypothetical protein EDB89DRAFT_1907533 [Lactarius sanguifluus]